jgi:hypothetical protein
LVAGVSGEQQAERVLQHFDALWIAGPELI